MSENPRVRHLTYSSYEDFLNADPRRRGDALELGTDWQDGPRRYRACWYQETGELTAECLNDGRLDLEDFHQGIAGPIHVLRRLPDRPALTALLGDWPNIAPGQPRTLQRLRNLASGSGAAPAKLRA
jgi:hypothetical protein